VEVLVETHPAADLEARVGARNVEEAIAIQAADLDVFDRFGLHRKVSRLGAGGCHQSCGAAQEKGFHGLHCNLLRSGVDSRLMWRSSIPDRATPSVTRSAAPIGGSVISLRCCGFAAS